MTRVQQTFGLGSLLILIWLFTTYDQVLAMEAIWRRSDTFAHGYFILPISLWLCWRDKHLFDASLLKPSMYAIFPLVVSIIGFVLAYAADINAASQLMTVTGLISIVWLTIGDKLGWRFKFPLIFLLFTVPIGQNIIPMLQDITAWFTVFFLKLTGIPVFRDGWYIQTPTGLVEVAVACSGIRYLIASAAVGALFAYLTYTSFKKQIIFFIFACILPIIANGLRAYLIVIIAHYSDMKYATGADHLVYGWFFFGFVIMIMFWVGGKFADPQKDIERPIGLSESDNSKLPLTSVTIASLLLVCVFFMKTNIVEVQVPTTPQAALSEADDKSIVWDIKFGNGLQRSLVTVKPGVEVMVATFGQKQSSGELISWDNTLFNRDRWTVVEKKRINVDAKPMMALTLRNTQSQQKTLVYSYKVGDNWLTNGLQVKVYQALNAIFYPNSRSTVIAVLLDQSLDHTVETQPILTWIEQRQVSNSNGERN